jgi:hypothetical protein
MSGCMRSRELHWLVNATPLVASRVHLTAAFGLALCIVSRNGCACAHVGASLHSADLCLSDRPCAGVHVLVQVLGKSGGGEVAVHQVSSAVAS